MCAKLDNVFNLLRRIRNNAGMSVCMSAACSIYILDEYVFRCMRNLVFEGLKEIY
jgi:hypothetical protein